MMKTEHDFKRAEDLFNKKLISEQEYNAVEAAQDGKEHLRKFAARNRTRRSRLESGARSIVEDDDLLTY
jgi:hypothetical protein